MKKSDIIRTNADCVFLWEVAMDEYHRECDHLKGIRLKSCTAWVYETTHYYFLRSYNTIVAFIDKRNDTLVDMLRYVYGYTSTSAQHINKFGKSSCFAGYGQGKWGCERRLTWYDVD